MSQVHQLEERAASGGLDGDDALIGLRTGLEQQAAFIGLIVPAG
jgi:hypothetical protein